MFLFNNLFVLHIQVPGNIKLLSLKKKKEKKKKSSAGKAKSLPRTPLSQHPPFTFPRMNQCPQWDLEPNFLRPGIPAPSDSRADRTHSPDQPSLPALTSSRLSPGCAPWRPWRLKLREPISSARGSHPSRLLAGLQGPVYSWAGGSRKSSFADKPQFPFPPPPPQSG